MTFIRDKKTNAIVRANLSEVLVRAAAVYSAAGLDFPQPQVVRWLDHQTPEFMSLPSFWLPVEELTDGSVFFVPWAKGSHAYLASLNSNRVVQPIDQADPAEWYGPLVERMKGWDMDPRTQDMMEFACEMMDPENKQYGELAARAFPKIRAAIDAGKIFVKSARELRSRGQPRSHSSFSPFG